jgi:hypothetical protein
MQPMRQNPKDRASLRIRKLLPLKTQSELGPAKTESKDGSPMDLRCLLWLHSWEKTEHLVEEQDEAVSGSGGRMIHSTEKWEIEEKCRRCGKTRTREAFSGYTWHH